VDLYLLRNCGTTWEKLGTAVTTSDGQHAETEGADDSGGRIYYELPPAQRLGPGRHRVRFVVAGDGTSADAFIEVVPAGAHLAVMDVDGTLTTSETAEFGALLTGKPPDAEPDAARVATALAAKGYRPYYLTARPEWLTARTREFLAGAGFPPGILETTTGGSGAVGADAATYKKAALARIAAKSLVPSFALGNTDTDAQAYAAANITPAGNRVFLRYTDGMTGGRRVEKYADLLPVIEQLAPICP
jgi:phosphatidate phosphatase PAH1